ncbi:MAG: sodium:alanine symporter family protein [Bifidobacteriaceae bacterium]|jgi:AGCS family alanine or glycine:cation symporter|nr:sodium:alanine symporter family protein [Bifidobacteriaceae bacterium]
MEAFSNIVGVIDSFVWSVWLLIPLLTVTGLVLTIRLRGVQFTKLWPALKLGLFKRQDPGSAGDITQFQALTTALAATVGVGNIVGVATAIGVGGPGALFWMWVTGLLGMASKYAETFLGSKYREKDSRGEVVGGPQVYLEKAIVGPVGKTLAILFAVFGALAAFGIGNGTQVKAMVDNMNSAFHVPALATGVIVMILVGLVLIGGIKAIGRATAAFVPFMIVVYLLAGIVVLAMNITAIPDAFALVFTDAFTGTDAVTGDPSGKERLMDFLGATMGVAIQRGMARGIFSNESGMGSAAIVAAAAKTSHPVRQGLVAMTQTFIDTIVVVSFTGLVIISTGVWKAADVVLKSDGTPELTDAGKMIRDDGGLTRQAFADTIGSNFGPAIVAICVVFFALSTVIGWSYYGERCAVRLLGIKAQMPYRVVFTALIVVWAVVPAATIWEIADILNGLMALPNLIGLLILSGMIARETKHYLSVDPDLTKNNVKPSALEAISLKGRRFVWTPAPERVSHR